MGVFRKQDIPDYFYVHMCFVFTIFTSVVDLSLPHFLITIYGNFFFHVIRLGFLKFQLQSKDKRKLSYLRNVVFNLMLSLLGMGDGDMKCDVAGHLLWT